MESKKDIRKKIFAERKLHTDEQIEAMSRTIDQLCDAGVVGPEEGTKPRKVLMSMEEFQNYLENQ